MPVAPPWPAAVLLDRDGVINEDSPHYTRNAEEWLPVPGSIEAIAALSAAGVRIGVCTNQTGIRRGYFGHQELAEMHRKMFGLCARHGGRISLLRYCTHMADDGCRCRKPAPGMLLDVCSTLGVAPSDCWFVGDSAKDLQAARSLGCQSVLVRTGKGRATELNSAELADAIYDNLADAVRALDIEVHHM